MKRIYNYRTNKLYEFEGGVDRKHQNNKRIRVINESDNEVMYKLCVREEALVDDVECDDDIEFEDRFETISDAITETKSMMDTVIEEEGVEDYEEIETDDEACVVYETEEKRYIFVVCPEDEEPDFEVYEVDDEDFEDESEDEFDIELDDEDFEDELDECDVRKHESVAKRFSRLRSIFESEDDSDSMNDETEEESDDEEETEKTDGEQETEKTEDDKKSNDESDEEEEMRAVAITVKTDDVDKCKEELIDAGILEDDIEVLDDKDGETQIRIDVNSIMELKDYLSGKGIDLEEEIGGEIVSDESEDSDDEESDEDETKDADAEKSDDEESDFDFGDLGDIFGDEE